MAKAPLRKENPLPQSPRVGMAFQLRPNKGINLFTL